MSNADNPETSPLDKTFEYGAFNALTAYLAPRQLSDSGVLTLIEYANQSDSANDVDQVRNIEMLGVVVNNCYSNENPPPELVKAMVLLIEKQLCEEVETAGQQALFLDYPDLFISVERFIGPAPSPLMKAAFSGFLEENRNLGSVSMALSRHFAKVGIY